MRTCPISLLALAPLLGISSAAHAHGGDEIYPFYELLDEDLARIDLTDGSVEDWLEVLGEPSLAASGFFWMFGSYDLSDLDFRIWLAWHQGSGTLWVAMERFDDLYFNHYDGAGLHEMVGWDSSIAFMVDGDHTAGIYGELLGINCEECTPEQVLWNHRQAQRWMAIAEAPGGELLDYDGASDWVIREPYAAAGGGVLGESPATTVTEFMLTPSTASSTTTRRGPKPPNSIPARSSGSRCPCWTMTAVGGMKKGHPVSRYRSPANGK